MRVRRTTLAFRRWQWAVLIMAVIMGGLVFGIVGLIVGANYGGNHCSSCEFNGLRGYEATGQLGLMVGGALGSVAAGLITIGLLIAKGTRGR